MDTDKITIFCANDGVNHRISFGDSLKTLSDKYCKTVTDHKTGQKFRVLAALADNMLKELSYRPMNPAHVEFIGYNNPDGKRCYTRSLCFVLQKAVRDLFPGMNLIVHHSLPSGLYCEIEETGKDRERGKVHFVTDEELDRLRTRMEEIVAADLPFTKKKMFSEEACKIFEQNGQPLKSALQKSLGTFNCSVYYLDGLADSFHGPLVPSTGYLSVFGLIAVNDGFCLQTPLVNDFSKVLPMKRLGKISAALAEHEKWCSIIGINSIAALNETVKNGTVIDLINLAESRHERCYAQIADQIYQNRGNARIIMIAGPSSSGKTSSSLRIALHCKALGLNPKVIELDNYFIDREKTPKDEDGNYDFESLYAMNLELLNSQLNDLADGKEVELPRFDFKEGKTRFEGNMLRLEDKDILIMEGIHALNPEMTSAVDSSKIFRVYVSALTSLNLDEDNNISTSDCRMLRRMVRDNRVRGIVPEETIMRWGSVRRGESNNIFPFQENADVVFNSTLVFELPLLKYYAEPLLRRIDPTSPAYTTAVRLLKFLDYVIALQPSEIAAIPPTSIMREFIGGQTLAR